MEEVKEEDSSEGPTERAANDASFGSFEGPQTASDQNLAGETAQATTDDDFGNFETA
jgi:hypothetical protein